MTYTALAGKLPRFVRNHILHFESSIEERLAQFAAGLPANARLLDAGAGEGQYAHLFRAQRYCGVDLAIGDTTWNYGRLDALADLAALPFRPPASMPPSMWLPWSMSPSRAGCCAKSPAR